MRLSDRKRNIHDLLGSVLEFTILDFEKGSLAETFAAAAEEGRILLRLVGLSDEAHVMDF